MLYCDLFSYFIDNEVTNICTVFCSSLSPFHIDGFGSGGTIELARTATGAEAGMDAGHLETVFFDGEDGLVGTMAKTGVARDMLCLGEAGEAVELRPT